MANLDLSKYGITGVTEIVHNPSYDVLFAEETKPSLEGFEKGQVTNMGAVNVMTGVYTGRSPKDKFFVKDETSENTVWWTSEEYKNDNKPVDAKCWKAVKELATKELSNKRLFVVDAFCGANENSRLKLRFIMEVAWQAHFVTNMFIRPTAEELANFGEPDFVIMNASKAKVENYKELGLNSETAVVFNLTEKIQVILNTWYGGEMKKGMFSYMNYLLPLNGMASMHCSANTDKAGESSAIFFGLSGTPFREVIVALRFRGTRFFRAECQQSTPVFPSRQFIHETRLQSTRRGQRRVGAHKIGDGNGGLIHQIVSDLAIFQIRIQRIVLQAGHHLLYDIHLSVVPGLLNLRIAIALLIQGIGSRHLTDRQQTYAGSQQAPGKLFGFVHKLFLFSCYVCAASCRLIHSC